MTYPQQGPYGQQANPTGYAYPAAPTPQKKPLWKKWWFWLIAVIAVIAVAFGTLLATTRADGFKDEAQKEQVWEAYKCNSAGDLTAGPIAIEIYGKILRDEIPSAQIADARRTAARLNRGGTEKTVSDYMEYKNTKTATHMCSGWLWDYLKDSNSYWTGYDDFTYSDAKAEGIVE